MPENDEQKALASELDFRRAARAKALDAETKHDPSNGQFTGGGGSSGGASSPSHNEAHRKANYHEAQAKTYKSNAEEASSPADKKRAMEMVAHHETQGRAMREKGKADGPTQKKPVTPQVPVGTFAANRERAAPKGFTGLPGMDPGRAKAIAGGAPMNAREISQMRNMKR